MWIKFRLSAAFAAAISATMLAYAIPAAAGTATASFSVTATVINSCLVSANSLAFPTYDPTTTAATTGSSTLNVTCTLGAPYTVALSNGSGTGADATAGASGRKMTGSGATLLGYNLYQDAGFSQAWGTSGAFLESGTGTGAVAALTVYGRVPASQLVTAGNYTDTINVTVSF